MGKKKPSKKPYIEPASDSDEDVSAFTKAFMAKQPSDDENDSDMEEYDHYTEQKDGNDSESESDSGESNDSVNQANVISQQNSEDRLSIDNDSDDSEIESSESSDSENDTDIVKNIDSSDSKNIKKQRQGKLKDTLESQNTEFQDDPGNDVSSEEEKESNEEESNVDEQFKQLRKELADLPFEDLQKLKEKIGVKMYNQAMFGGNKGQKQKQPGDFKRANKNRPREMSSKKRVSRFREVLPIPKKVHRDPRFDDLSGTYSEDIFTQNYAFLSDVKEHEKAKLLKSYKKEKNTEKKKQLEQLINRMSQQENVAKQKEKTKTREREIKKKERELVSQGKTPFYLKQSEKKKLELAEKFRELKKSGKVDNYMSKKRKKNASKEKRKLPKGFTR